MSGSAPSVGDTVGGKYVIEQELGRGGMGAVFRARHTLTDRAVALKWLIPDPDYGDAAVQRFLREARAMGRIDHANVVGVLDVGSEGGSAWLAMELLRGRSLRSYLPEDRGLPLAEALALLLPALDGVAAAHAVGVVHRDLKPENLFVVEEGGRARTTKVLDFGISKVREDPSKAPAITQTGTTMGTPSYMAPEQVRGAKDIDARADVWSLAVILYEMLTARTPFTADTYGGLMIAIVMEPHAPVDTIVPGLPMQVSRAIDRALSKDPAGRYPDVASFAQVLAPFASAAAPSPPILEGLPPPRSATPLDPGRPSATPTRAAKPSATPSAGAPTATPQARIELDSNAARRPAGTVLGPSPARAPAPANASVPLSVPDLPITPMPPSPRRATPYVVVVLGVATLGLIGAVVANEAMRPAQAPVTHHAAPAPVAAPRPAPPPIATVPTAPPIAVVPPDAGVAARPAIVAPARAEGRARPHRPRGEPAATTPAPAQTTPAATGRTGQLSREEF